MASKRDSVEQIAAPDAGPKKPSISLSRDTFARLKKWCKTRGVPHAAIVELLAARAIGIPLAQLPESVQRFSHLLPDLE